MFGQRHKYRAQRKLYGIRKQNPLIAGIKHLMLGWLLNRETEQMLTVGKSYYSQCFNRIKIISRELIDTDSGPDVWHYVGRVIDTKDHMDILLNKLHRFNEDGRWINQEGVVLGHSIHDIKEEIPSA
jgi:site-specific recombinase